MERHRCVGPVERVYVMTVERNSSCPMTGCLSMYDVPRSHPPSAQRNYSSCLFRMLSSDRRRWKCKSPTALNRLFVVTAELHAITNIVWNNLLMFSSWNTNRVQCSIAPNFFLNRFIITVRSSGLTEKILRNIVVKMRITKKTKK